MFSFPTEIILFVILGLTYSKIIENIVTSYLTNLVHYLCLLSFQPYLWLARRPPSTSIEAIKYHPFAPRSKLTLSTGQGRVYVIR